MRARTTLAGSVRGGRWSRSRFLAVMVFSSLPMVALPTAAYPSLISIRNSHSVVSKCVNQMALTFESRSATMALDFVQFKALVKKVLHSLDLDSRGAVNLILGTAAQESRFGTYLVQRGGGPATGIFQIEPATFRYLQEKYSQKYPEIAGRKTEEMEWDLRLDIIMCRLKYLSIPEKLPAFNDLDEMADYWKKYYNTPLGRGTTDEFIGNYNRYVRFV